MKDIRANEINFPGTFENRFGEEGRREERFEERRFPEERFEEEGRRDERFRDEDRQGERFEEERFPGERFGEEGHREERFPGERFGEERFGEEGRREERFPGERFGEERFGEGFGGEGSQDERRGEEDPPIDNRGRDRRRLRVFGPRELFPRNIFPAPREEIRFLQNGIIQRLSRDGRNGFVTVMMNLENRFGPNQMQAITLVVTPDTVLRDQNFRTIRFRDLRVGMTVFAAYSARMTRSITPQSVAFSIIAIVEEPFVVSTGRVAFVDVRNNRLVTGNRNNINSQVIYNLTEDTEIFDRRGFRMRLNQIRPGDFVQIEHATFQTASIPPQTTAFRIFVLS